MELGSTPEVCPHRQEGATGKKANSANNPMVNNPHTHNAESSESQQGQRSNVPTPLSRVRQDKGAEYRASRASHQPASAKKSVRLGLLNTKTPRSQKRSSASSKAEKVTIWLKSSVKAELERIAKQETLSLSATGAAFLEKAIQSNLHEQHGALLETIITQAIGRGMRAYSNRIVMLLIRVAFDTGQTRALVTNVLQRQPGITPELLNTILDGSSNTAKRNITTRTPQLENLIEELEKVFTQAGGGENTTGNT